MLESFAKKQQTLLTQLRKIALMHNRDYFVSLIPFVESATADQEDLIDAYIVAVDEDRQKLTQSRDALATPERVNYLI
jgi:hypothetical protein